MPRIGLDARVVFGAYALALGILCGLHWLTGDVIPIVTTGAHLTPWLALVSLVAIPFAWGCGRRWASLGLLLSATAGCILALPALPSRPNPDQANGASTLRIRTWNVGDGRANATEIAEALAHIDADIVCLQELDSSVGAALAPLVAAQFPHRVLHALGRDGKALLSRWPILREELLQPTHGHNIQRAVIDFDGTTISVQNAHPSAILAFLGRWAGDESNLLQAAEEAGSHPHGILAGDFNLTPISESYRRIQEHGLRNAFALGGRGFGLSFPLFGRYRGVPLPPLVRIDHVWVSSGFGVLSCSLGADGGSDHLPLDVVLAVR